MIERRVEIPYRGGGLYSHLFSMGKTFQNEFDITDDEIIEIIDGSVDNFTDDICDSRGGWENMKNWIDQRWPKGWSEDLGSRSESLPLYIAYGMANPNYEMNPWIQRMAHFLDPILNVVYGRFEDLVKPQRISLRINSWRWKRGLDGWSESLTVPTNLFQIDPDVFHGWGIIIQGVPVSNLINRRLK